jgi:Haloacid Dehalogenase superfamily, subfamily IB, phosphoserine phosphatase-like
MIYINESAKAKIDSLNYEKVHILTDFDRTITIGSSESSWSILSKSKLVPKEYIEERQELYNYYRPIEIDEKLDFKEKNKLMIEWWNKHIRLFIKYKLPESVINNAANNLHVMSFREGASKFLEAMKENNVPVIIISAGIGNFIEQFLIKNKCNFSNIYIVSNFITFENGIASGIKDNLIHSLNKNEVAIPEYIKSLIKHRENIILLGDSVSDIKMAPTDTRANALKIGFLEEKEAENFQYFIENFDIVCTENTSYHDLKDLIHF